MSNHSSEKAPSHQSAHKSLRQTQVPQGIAKVYYSLIVTLLGITGGALSPFLIAGNVQLVSIVLIGLGLLLLGAALMNIVGTLQCLSAPDHMPSRDWITFSVFFSGVSLLITVAGLITKIHPIFGLCNNLCSTIAFVSFLVFLKHLAYYIQDNDLGYQAERLLNFGVIIIGLFIGSIALAFIAQPLAGLGMILVLILGVIGFIRYAALLRDMNEALSRS